MLLKHLCICLLAIVAIVGAQDYHGKPYQQKSASEKSALLQKAVLTDTTANGFYSTEEMVSQLLLEDMNTSFDTVADDMPTQFLGVEYRKKIVHTVGAVGLAQWTVVPNSLNYTGIYASGCNNIIIRFSSAFRPGTTNSTDSPNLAPALGLKFLRDGIPSANIFALGTLLGQTSYNFFLHDSSNHLPDIPSDSAFAFKMIRDKFSQASNFPMMLGASHLSAYDQHGNKVSGNVNFPYRLIFHPVTSYHSAYPDTYPGVSYNDQLSATVKPGPIYEIYAINDPVDDSNLTAAVQIATLSMTTTLTDSDFGDKHLFLQHPRLEDDLALKPQWVATVKEIMAKQQAMSSPYSYPDLPWN